MKESWKGKIQCLAVLCLLIAFYALTRPLNHAESYDGINYALFAENFPLGTAPDSRNILFHVVNRILVVASESLGLNVGTLELLSSVSIVTGALSLILFARLMRKRFQVSAFSANSGAAFLGLSYGYWRYAGGVEVYVPSIFLILCCLTLIFKYLNDENLQQGTLIAAGVLSGLAVLFYQPNVIVLFAVAFILFCSTRHFFSFVSYSAIGALVVVSGIVMACAAVNGDFPSPDEVVSFLKSRNSEFGGRPSIGVALVKLVLAFGHDLFSAHWTRTIDPVRNFLDPLIPGCVYNFNVVTYAGRGIQSLTAIAAILFVPLLLVLLRMHWVAKSRWKLTKPSRGVLFLFAWLGLLGLVVGTIDPGSFEAWIPVLVPFAALLTVLVIEPCYQLGKQKTVLSFLFLMLCYNFFGGALIWRNTDGDYFAQKTTWIRQELTEGDVVLLNEFDYRLVDYLNYYGDAQVANLYGENKVTISRSHPDIHSITLDVFLKKVDAGQFRLFVMGDVLTPDPAIKKCRYGEHKFEAAMELAKRIKPNAVMVDSGRFGEMFQIKPAK